MEKLMGVFQAKFFFKVQSHNWAQVYTSWS